MEHWKMVVCKLIVRRQTIVSVFQNSVNTLPKMVNHFFFVKKLKILYSLDHTILFKFHQHVVQILINPRENKTNKKRCGIGSRFNAWTLLEHLLISRNRKWLSLINKMQRILKVSFRRSTQRNYNHVFFKQFFMYVAVFRIHTYYTCMKPDFRIHTHLY